MNLYEYKAVIILNSLNNSNYLKNLEKVRFQNCKNCKNCKIKDCGLCISCKDKPKFGGIGIRKQSCKNKPCCIHKFFTFN